MGKITINGRPLHEMTPLEIVLATSVRPHRRHGCTPRSEYYRNADLLAAFGDAEIVHAAEIAAAFVRINAAQDWSENFNALRAGEALQWGIEQGIVERVGARPGPAWLLLVREQQFEIVGPTTKGRAVRIRGLAGAEAVVAAKLWTRELKRRERARLKRMARHKSSTSDWLGTIVRRAPDTALTGPLERFIFGEHKTIGGAHELIIAAVADMSSTDAYQIDTYLGLIRSQLPPVVRRPPVVDADDYAQLGELNL